MKSKGRTVIEFTERAVKIVRSVLTARGRAIAFCAIVPIGGLDDREISREIKRVFTAPALRVGYSPIVIAVSRQSVFCRYLSLPSQREEEIARMVELQAAQFFPYDRDEITLHFRMVDHEDGGCAKVLVVAALQDTLKRFWSICRDAGLKPQDMTVSNLGLQFWRGVLAPAGEDVTAVVNVDDAGADLVFCGESGVLFSRSVRAGLGSSNGEGLQELKRQTDLTLQGFMKEKFSSPVGRFIMIPAQASLAVFCHYLTETYHVPCQVADIKKMSERTPGCPWPNAPGDDARMAAVVGMALMEEMPTVHLIPTEIRENAEGVRKQRHAVWIVLLACAAMFFMFADLHVRLWQKQAVLREITEQVQMSRKKIDDVQGHLRVVRTIEEALTSRVIFTDIMAELTRLLPAGVSVTSLKLANGTTLVLQGLSLNTWDISEMQKRMLDTAFFTNVTLDYVNQRVNAEGEQAVFQITCQIKSKRPEGNR